MDWVIVAVVGIYLLLGGAMIYLLIHGWLR